MAEYHIKLGKLGKALIGAYYRIENGVVSGYQKIEDGAVGTYKKIETAFVDRFLEKTDDAPEEKNNSH